MTEGEAITAVEAQEAAPAAEPAVEQTKAAEQAPAAETAPVPKPVEASGSDAVLLETEQAPKKKDKKGFSLPKVNLDVKCKFKRGALPEPNFTPKYYKDVEYSNRDQHNLHPDIKVNFSDVIAEPDGAHSFATIWGTSFKSYSLVKYWTYRILTAVLAVPLSIMWGLYFALLAFCSIWCIVPFIRGFVIWAEFVKKVWGLMVRTFLDPLFESLGLIFTKIHVTLRMKNETVEDAEKQS
jgi:caveolin 1